jgi:hypothetical protein
MPQLDDRVINSPTGSPRVKLPGETGGGDLTRKDGDGVLNAQAQAKQGEKSPKKKKKKKKRYVNRRCCFPLTISNAFFTQARG